MSHRGVKELLEYQAGKKLSLKQTIIAKCADCMGNYVDGRVDCKMNECPLYPFMPYGEIWKNRVKKPIPKGFLKFLGKKGGFSCISED